MAEVQANAGAAIEAVDLRKTYRDGFFWRHKFDALKGVSFQVRKGEIFGLLGPNGAGKTTFLKILLGIIRKSGGQASMLGFPAGSRRGRGSIGYLPEQLRMPRHLTGNSAMQLYGNLSNLGNQHIRSRRDELLDLVGLGDRADDRVQKYSKGMLQRLGLAQALLHDPQLLVLDEPTDGLDPRARAEMRAIIRKLKEKGVTIFLNSHILQEVELVCDHVAILDRGILRYSGSVDTIGDFVASQAGGAPNMINIEFELKGNNGAVQQCLDDMQGELVSRESRGDEMSFVKAQFAQQAEIDQLIDQFRASRISVFSMRREQISLEDAFLRILDDASDRDDTSPPASNPPAE